MIEWKPTTLLGRLPRSARYAIVEAGQGVGFKPKQTLLHQGGKDDHVLLLLGGMVKVIAHSATGEDAVLAIRSAGDLVGEMAALENSQRMATVVTCREVRARLIQRSALEDLMLAHPLLAVQIAQMISARLRYAEERHIEAISYDARVRLCRTLVMLVDAYGVQRGSRWEVDVGLTQTQLGSMAGIKRRAAETLISKLRNERLIEWRRHMIIVTDLPGLTEISGGPRKPQ